MAEKKHSNLLVLEILKDESDENHPLSVKEIQNLLYNRYGITLERRSVYSNIDILRQQGYQISDFNDNGRGYYLEERQFDKGEVLLLCNAIHASHFISQKQSDKLIKTLLATQSKYDRKEFSDQVYLPNKLKADTKQLMINIEILSKAIQEKKVLEFTYLHYDKNKKLVPKRGYSYQFEPRYIVYADSKPYMIATSLHHEGFIHFRLDKMRDLHITEEKARRLPKDMDAYEYAGNKLFMYAGNTGHVTFRCDDFIFDSMVDLFGKDLNVLYDKDGYFDISVQTSEQGALYLAQQYMEHIEILEPKELRKQFKDNLQKATEKYAK